MKDMIREREHALEEEFFTRREQELLGRMREAAEAAADRQALASATGIQDAELLGGLLDVGVRAENVPALSIVPLVFVAWADHRLAGVERRAVLEAAHQFGIEPGSVPAQILEGWLAERPGERLLLVWERWIRMVARSISASELAELEKRILGLCRDVAHAAGGFLETGLPIDPEQRDVIAEIESVFEEMRFYS